MSLNVNDFNRLFISVIVNCCFLATFLAVLTLIFKVTQSDAAHATGFIDALLPKAGGCGLLLSACTVIQLRLLPRGKKDDN